MHILSSLWFSIQTRLFPALEEELDPLTEKQKQFVTVMEIMGHVALPQSCRRSGTGRKPKDRHSFLKAFIAKAVYDFTTTELLVEHLRSNKNLHRLCGWEYKEQIPSLSTFSRAFAQFAEGDWLVKAHEAMVKNSYGDKIAGHVSRDSSAIEAREKPIRKQAGPKPPKRKKGRPKKDEIVAPKEPSRLSLQANRSLAENLADLPRACDIGTKKNSKGHCEHWIGYKLHADVVDGEIPVSLVLTSASLHDSQGAIPLAQMTRTRVTSLYDLMDAAYDADDIKKYSKELGHVPLIDSNPRRGEKISMSPAEKNRYKNRTTVERFFSMLKDNHGGRHVRVRGPQKVMAHLMFGAIVITATQLMHLLA